MVNSDPSKVKFAEPKLTDRQVLDEILRIVKGLEKTKKKGKVKV